MACEQLAEELTKRANAHSAAWHKRVSDLMRGVAEHETESGNRCLFLDPMTVTGVDADAFDPALAKHLLPVILAKDVWHCYGRVEERWKSERLIGLGRIKLHLTPGLVVTYMLEQVCQILPLYNEIHDEVSGQLSGKYLLPLIYRHLEETSLPSPYAFEAESQWLGLIKADIPIETLLARPHLHQPPHQPPHQHQHSERDEAMLGSGGGDLRSIILSIVSKRGEAAAKRGEVMVTGVTAALLELGIPLDRIPLPLELTTAELGPAIDSLRSALSGSGSLEVRQFGVSHPSGSWYVSVVQFILSPHTAQPPDAAAKPGDRGRIAVMLYDTIRYIAAGVTASAPAQTPAPAHASQRMMSSGQVHSSGLVRFEAAFGGSRRLSPFVIMTQLCYSAWLLERRGIERSKWVYSILRSYRNRLAAGAGAEAAADSEKERYKMMSQPVEWLTHYLRRSSSLTQRAV